MKTRKENEPWRKMSKREFLPKHDHILVRPPNRSTSIATAAILSKLSDGTITEAAPVSSGAHSFVCQ